MQLFLQVLANGVLLGGLVFGWLRSLRPFFVRIPSPTLWLFESLGLTGFIAVVGLSAGPDFVRGLQESGLTLVVAALVVVKPDRREFSLGKINRKACDRFS